MSFQKLSHEAPGGRGIAPTLHQDVEDEALLIHGSPQPLPLPTNGDDDLVEVSFVAELSG